MQFQCLGGLSYRHAVAQRICHSPQLRVGDLGTCPHRGTVVLFVARLGRRQPRALLRDRLWWDAFDPEVKGERRHWWEDGAFMIAETWYQGIHRGPFFDYAPTGRPISPRPVPTV
jgi:hypothetical protein